MIKVLSTVFQKKLYRNVMLLVYTTPSSMTHWSNSKNIYKELRHFFIEDIVSFKCWNYHLAQIVITTIGVKSFFAEIFNSFLHSNSLWKHINCSIVPWSQQKSMLRLFLSIIHIISLNTDSPFICSH